ncbi:spermidine synthase [Cohnella suwonensis]|uniref:Spermidine synthase n=1 Tax=Cohnella suwonensis TaxID=696072 RepID=A0ABW0LTK1_9BACL
MRLLIKETTPYNEISVYETTELYGKKGSYRILRFADEAVQGAMDLEDPGRVVLEYQRAVIHLLRTNAPSFANVFSVGHGIGTIAAHDPDKRFVVAEIDGKLEEFSRRYFGYGLDNVRIGDGRELLEREEPDTYDAIVVDAFTHEGTPSHFTTLEFFAMAKTKLISRGTVILNLFGKRNNDRLTDAIHSTLGEAFEYTKVFFRPGNEADNEGNLMIAGSDKRIDYKERQMPGFREIDIGKGYIIRD